MAILSFEGTERKPDRLEAFSDAVLAIAVTLLVVERQAPKPEVGDLAAAYSKLAPGDERGLAEESSETSLLIKRR